MKDVEVFWGMIVVDVMVRDSNIEKRVFVGSILLFVFEWGVGGRGWDVGGIYSVFKVKIDNFVGLLNLMFNVIYCYGYECMFWWIVRV